MQNHQDGRRLSRRNFLALGGGMAAAAAGVAVLPWRGRTLNPVHPAKANALTVSVKRQMAATDGWISLPGTVATYAPDPMAPAGFTTYIFGFRDVTNLGTQLMNNQKGKVQHTAPQMYYDEGDVIQIELANLGMQYRPDLVDSHTIHWHGFRNALPIFDGVPEMSISVPIGRTFPYLYHPTDAGTYMYHCHFEDVEHVQMGMNGLVFVRPAQNKTGNAAGAPVARYNGGPANAPLGYVYNDGVAASDPNSTAYDREFQMHLSEMWAFSHYNDAHVQNTDWSDYRTDFFLLNGRSYPDTLAPNGSTNLGTGEMNPLSANGRNLQYQPNSSLVECNAGDRVLLRFTNLGYSQAAMRLYGIPMHVVGKDATILTGRSASGARTGTNTSYVTDTVYIGAGESYDAIFTAPAKTGGGAYDTYLLYNSSLGALTLPGGAGLAGQMTEVHVYPAGSLPPQTAPSNYPMLNR